MKPNIMNLPKRLLDAASTDKHRPILQGAHIDPEHRAIVCCDGRMIAIHPIPGDAPVKPGYITPATWKIAKARNTKVVEYDFAAGTINGVPLDEPKDYPNYRQVLPNEATAFRIHLNPDLITRLASSLDFDAESRSHLHALTFEFDASGENPVRIIWGDKSGVIMPFRAEGGGLVGHDASASVMAAEIERLKKALSERSDNTAASAAPAAGDAEDAGDVAPTVPLRPSPPVKQLDTARTRKAAQKAPKAPVPPASAPPTVTHNAGRDGIELRFNGKPDDATRLAMKAHGFRWLPGQPGQPWAAKYSEEAWLFANSLATGSPYTPMPEPVVPATAPPEVPPVSEWTRSTILPVQPKPAEAAAATSRVRRITLPEF